jgi:DNA-binding transcriptional LysR family regulator
MNAADPADLRAFVAIARHQSFRRAADELGVTPSALSHGLRTLEDRLGVRLFNRTTRSVALTEAGDRLLGRVAPAFQDIADAIEDLNRFRDRPAGTLRINAAHLACHLALLPMLGRFAEACPDVQVEIVADQALSDIVAQGFDMGIRFGETLAQDMIAVPLGGRVRFAVVGSPDFFKRHRPPQTPHDLRDLPCIRYRFTSGSLYRWEFERGSEELSVEVSGSLTVSDQSLMIRPALDGMGLAYVFADQVREDVAAGRLISVLADWCPYYPGFYLYYPGRRQMPAASRAFIDYIRQNRE